MLSKEDIAGIEYFDGKLIRLRINVKDHLFYVTKVENKKWIMCCLGKEYEIPNVEFNMRDAEDPADPENPVIIAALALGILTNILTDRIKTDTELFNNVYKMIVGSDDESCAESNETESKVVNLLKILDVCDRHMREKVTIKQSVLNEAKFADRMLFMSVVKDKELELEIL